MGPEIPLAVTLLILTAGGIGLCVVIGLRPGTIPGWVAFLGLSYLTGISAFMIAAQFLLVIGMPAWLALVAVGAIPLAIIRVRLPEAALTEPWTGIDRFAVALFAVIVTVLVGLGSLTAFENPLYVWDGWAIWGQKALMLQDGLTAQFTNPDYEPMHPDYPVGLPALQATVFTLAGEVATTEGDLPIWMMLPAFGLAIGFLAPVRPAYWVPVAGALLVLPFMVSGSLTNYADVPTAILLGTALLVGGRWLSEKDEWQVWLFGVLIGGAMCVKNEGVLIGFVLLIAVTALGWQQRRHLLPAWLVVLAAFLPWRIWITLQGLSSDLQVEKLADPVYLVSNFDRVWTSAGRLFEKSLFGLQGVELVLWVVFLLAAAALLVSGWRRPGAQLVLAGLAGSFAALLLAYWLSPHDLEWHLLTSADRVIITPVIILVIGVLLTIESAFDRKRRDGGESIGSSRS